MNLPKTVEFVIRKIMDAGGQAWLVGGALRDWMLGKPVMDYDIASSLLPEQIEEVFSAEQTWPSGKRFGTITVNVDGTSVEITTFRRESYYSDSRHPDQVVFVPEIYLDLARRDFTINAMAYNPYESLVFVDPFSGKADLQNRMIRTVGDPEERFTEDPLRIMRGIRFSAQLDFEIQQETRAAMKCCSQMLQEVSAERLRSELDSLLLSPHPDKGLMLLQETDVLSFLLHIEDKTNENESKASEFNKQSAQIIKSISPSLAYRLSTLFSMLYPEDFAAASRLDSVINKLIRLRYDKKSINHILKMLKGYSTVLNMDITPFSIRELLGRMGIQDMEQCLKWYKVIKQAEQDFPGLEKGEKASKLLEDIIKLKHPVYFHQLAINGKDVLQAGIGQQDPKIIGEALNLAYRWVLEKPTRNQPGCLIAMLLDYYSIP